MIFLPERLAVDEHQRGRGLAQFEDLQRRGIEPRYPDPTERERRRRGCIAGCVVADWIAAHTSLPFTHHVDQGARYTINGTSAALRTLVRKVPPKVDYKVKYSADPRTTPPVMIGWASYQTDPFADAVWVVGGMPLADFLALPDVLLKQGMTDEREDGTTYRASADHYDRKIEDTGMLPPLAWLRACEAYAAMKR